MKQPTLRVLITADAVGGVWQYAVDLSRALLDQQIEPIIAVLGPSPSADQIASAAGIRVIDTKLPLDWLCSDAAPVLAAGDAIAELADCEVVDCVQLNMPTLGARATFRMPVVAMTHGCVSTWWEAAHGTRLAEDYHWHRALMGQALRAGDAVIAPTAAFGAVIARHYDLPAAPLTVQNGRLSQQIEPAVAIHDHVFTVGRLWDRVKNIAVLDRVAARLSIPFFAAGTSKGPHGETIEVEALHLLGTLGGGEIADRLSKRPIFASAASFEPFGLAVLEAASAGCALVLSDIPTFRELWDGVATFVPLNDDAAFAHAINEIIGDEGRRIALGNAARERAGNYTPAIAAGQMARIYRTLVTQSGSSGRVAA